MPGFVFDLQTVLVFAGLRAGGDVEHSGVFRESFGAAIDCGFQSVEVLAGRQQREFDRRGGGASRTGAEVEHFGAGEIPGGLTPARDNFLSADLAVTGINE